MNIRSLPFNSNSKSIFETSTSSNRLLSFISPIRIQHKCDMLLIIHSAVYRNDAQITVIAPSLIRRRRRRRPLLSLLHHPKLWLTEVCGHAVRYKKPIFLEFPRMFFVSSFQSGLGGKGCYFFGTETWKKNKSLKYEGKNEQLAKGARWGGCRSPEFTLLARVVPYSMIGTVKIWVGLQKIEGTKCCGFIHHIYNM